MESYFAYGSNLNQADLDQWCEKKGYSKIRFQSWQRAVLYGFKLDFTHYSSRRKGGTADLVPSLGEFVEGVLFGVSEEIMKLIDEKEGREKKKGKEVGIYKRIIVKVQLEDRKEIEATTYQVCNPEPFQAPHGDHLKVIIEGAKAYGLSDGWIRTLEQIATTNMNPRLH